MADTEELATGYTLVNNTQTDAGTFLLQRIGLVPGMRVLDIGCGPGNLTSHIADVVGDNGNVVGIDPRYAEDLSPFPTASFDAIFVNSTLHWIQDQNAAINEFARVLKSGGYLGISGGSGDYITAQEKIKADVLSREPYKIYPEESPPRFLKQRELECLLSHAGFADKKIGMNKIIKSAKDSEEMIDWLDTSSSGKTYGSIPPDLRANAREEMKREWNKLAAEDGIHMEMELLVTMALRD